MEDSKYQIFEQSEAKKIVSYNWIMFRIWAFALTFFWVTEKYFVPNDFYKGFKNTYLILAVLLSTYFLLVGLWSYKPLKGELRGYIEFKMDSIDIDNETFQLKNITQMDISNSDYYGRQTRGIRLDFSPGLSQGVNNYIEFTDTSGFYRKVYFKKTSKDQYKELSDFIILGIRAGKIPSSRISGVHGM
jgi:hypothetical protein